MCFLIGFGEGAKSAEQNIFLEFDLWLQKKVGKNYSFHWSRYILEVMCENDENKAKVEVINLLIEFCKVDNEGLLDVQ